MGKRRLLLVEDDEDRVLLTRKALAECPAEPTIEVAGTADEALRMLAQSGDRPPDLVLLDLELPGGDGFEVLEALRAPPDPCLAPVVVLTTSDRREALEKSYDLGANGYVTKPVDFEDFRDVIHHIARFWLEANEPPPDGP